MNIEVIKDFTENFLVNLPDTMFDMDVLLQRGDFSGNVARMLENNWSCGAVGCIAGLGLVYKAVTQEAAYVDDVKKYTHSGTMIIPRTTGELFELSDIERGELFYHYPNSEPRIGWKDWILIRLRRVIATGEVEHWRDVPGLRSDQEDEDGTVWNSI